MQRDNMMNTELMNLFVRYMEKQEILSKLTEDEKLHGYNYSEIHTIAAIGDLQEPNVTNIAKRMHVTRGAISKITKRLLSQNLIEAYQQSGNNQKIFFRLTEAGQYLYDEHEKRHNLWLKRDDAFIKQFDNDTLKLVEAFMTKFNNYLEIQISALGGHADED
jgi:DNA-binding MarR family transcriptional regulator